MFTTDIYDSYEPRLVFSFKKLFFTTNIYNLHLLLIYCSPLAPGFVAEGQRMSSSLLLIQDIYYSSSIYYSYLLQIFTTYIYYSSGYSSGFVAEGQRSIKRKKI